MPHYSGIEILEVMAEAKNYNAFIENLITTSLKGPTILDFGAGSGQFALPLKKNGWTVECVETDLHLADGLKKKSFTVYPDITAASLYDSIYSVNVLEHIENDQKSAQELLAHLNPGGRLLIYVPAFSILYSRFDKKIGHHRRYTRKSLAALFPQAKIIQCHYADSLGFFAGLCFKYFGPIDGRLSKKAVVFYDAWLFPLSRKLDSLFKPFIGKNLFLVAEKKS